VKYFFFEKTKKNLKEVYLFLKPFYFILLLIDFIWFGQIQMNKTKCRIEISRRVTGNVSFLCAASVTRFPDMLCPETLAPLIQRRILLFLTIDNVQSISRL